MEMIKVQRGAEGRGRAERRKTLRKLTVLLLNRIRLHDAAKMQRSWYFRDFARTIDEHFKNGKRGEGAREWRTISVRTEEKGTREARKAKELKFLAESTSLGENRTIIEKNYKKILGVHFVGTSNRISLNPHKIIPREAR